MVPVFSLNQNVTGLKRVGNSYQYIQGFCLISCIKFSLRWSVEYFRLNNLYVVVHEFPVYPIFVVVSVVLFFVTATPLAFFRRL